MSKPQVQKPLPPLFTQEEIHHRRGYNFTFCRHNSSSRLYQNTMQLIVVGGEKKHTLQTAVKVVEGRVDKVKLA